MKKSEIRILDMLRRARQHGQQRAADFPANSRGHELYVIVGTSVVNMERLSAEQAMYARAYREKTAQKNVADKALHDLMESMSRTARSMKRSHPGVEETFRLPSKRDGETWLATANAFATEAVALNDELVRRSMPPDFVDDLKARILSVKQAGEEQARASAGRIASTAALAEAAQTGLAAVRELDPIVRNVYKGNETELAAWESASHVERAARRAEEEEEPPLPPPPAQG